MQHWSRVVAWTLCNRLPRATNVCRLPAPTGNAAASPWPSLWGWCCGGEIYETNECKQEIKSSTGGTLESDPVTACKAVFVDSKCGWVACLHWKNCLFFCASMLCDELCEGEVLRLGVWSFMSQTSPRETWRFHEAWSIPDIHIESIPMICLIHSRKTRYLKRTQCLSQWFFPQWPVTSSGLRIPIQQPGFHGSFKTCRCCYFSEFQVFQESCFMPPNFRSSYRDPYEKQALWRVDRPPLRYPFPRNKAWELMAYEPYGLLTIGFP